MGFVLKYMCKTTPLHLNLDTVLIDVVSISAALSIPFIFVAFRKSCSLYRSRILKRPGIHLVLFSSRAAP